MSWPQPTPQYGQIDRATCASSMRACIARVSSDIASSPVPSARSRIWRMSGHLQNKPVSDVILFNRLSGNLCCYLMRNGKAQKLVAAGYTLRSKHHHHQSDGDSQRNFEELVHCSYPRG